jgi:hypothetical protein
LSQAANGLGFGDTTMAGITTPAEAACEETSITATPAMSSKLLIGVLPSRISCLPQTRYRNPYPPSRPPKRSISSGTCSRRAHYHAQPKLPEMLLLSVERLCQPPDRVVRRHPAGAVHGVVAPPPDY